MAKVVLYTKPFCGFCSRAKRLLDERGVDYDEIDVSWDPEREREMIERAGGAYTVPQIFIGEVHVGGSDELVALDRSGKLTAMLNGDGSRNDA